MKKGFIKCASIREDHAYKRCFEDLKIQCSNQFPYLVATDPFTQTYKDLKKYFQEYVLKKLDKIRAKIGKFFTTIYNQANELVEIELQKLRSFKKLVIELIKKKIQKKIDAKIEELVAEIDFGEIILGPTQPQKVSLLGLANKWEQFKVYIFQIIANKIRELKAITYPYDPETKLPRCLPPTSMIKIKLDLQMKKELTQEPAVPKDMYKAAQKEIYDQVMKEIEKLREC